MYYLDGFPNGDWRLLNLIEFGGLQWGHRIYKDENELDSNLNITDNCNPFFDSSNNLTIENDNGPYKYISFPKHQDDDTHKQYLRSEEFNFPFRWVFNHTNINFADEKCLIVSGTMLCKSDPNRHKQVFIQLYGKNEVFSADNLIE
uniref:Uncharacterized protein n=1 Tax=Panagrolaimus davidi TaxID=227884 RepID=A0A914PKN4_9BILA